MEDKELKEKIQDEQIGHLVSKIDFYEKLINILESLEFKQININTAKRLRDEYRKEFCIRLQKINQENTLDI